MNLDQHIGKTVSGSELEKILDGMPLLKFMHDDNKHFDLLYRTGMNIDFLPFSPSGQCQPGGLYVTTLKDYYFHQGRFGAYARRVIVPPDAEVYIEPGSLKCSKIILDVSKPKNKLIKKLFSEYEQYLIKHYGQDVANKFIVTMIETYGLTIQYMEPEMRTQDLMLIAIKQHGGAFRFIDKEIRTSEFMNKACDFCEIPRQIFHESQKDRLLKEFVEHNMGPDMMKWYADTNSPEEIEEDLIVFVFIEKSLGNLDQWQGNVIQKCD